MIKFVMTKARIKRPSYKHMDIYIYIQGRIQDLAQGGGTEFCTLLRFCTIYIMSLQENIKKKIFVPPLNHSGGEHFGCPPPELLRRGTILRGGGTVPLLKLLRGGTVPYSPPVSALVYIDRHIYMKI